MKGWKGNSTVNFGHRRVGDGEPCFITFEAGPTHSGLESAKRLVDLAAKAGADAVKFQMTDADRIVADRSLPFTYTVLTDRVEGTVETVTEPLYDILKRRELSFEQWREVKDHADSLGVAVFFTVGFDDLVDRVVEIGCHSIKIASADVNHFPLIRKAARTGLCIQLDSGNATMGEIERALDVILDEGNKNIIIHNCPSGYPARLDSINLRFIPTLKRAFGFPVAYSDHVPGWEMDVAALAFGANLVEKTITEDRCTRSIEHMFSLDPTTMHEFVSTIKNVEKAFGNKRRRLTVSERTARKKIRRSTYLVEKASAGTRLRDVSVTFSRPGDGIGPDLYEELLDLLLATDLPAGHKLAFTDLR